MTKISDLMTPDPLTVRPDDLVLDHEDMFEENRIHHIPVVAEDGEVVGMVSNRDIENYASIMKVSAGSSPTKVKIRDIMTTPVFSYFDDVDVKHAASAMVDNNIHAIVVMNKSEEMIGIVTSTDLLRYLAQK